MIPARTRTGLLIATMAVLVTLGAAGAGCGAGSDTDPPAAKPAGDRSGQIASLKKQRAALQARKARAARKAAAKRRASAAQATENAAAGGPTGDLDGIVAGLPGQAGVVVGAPGGGGPRSTGGGLTTGSAWSTIKVPIAERVLTDDGGPDSVGAGVRDQITAAITQSDNDAAAALFTRLESSHGGLTGASEAVGQMLRAAGDGSTVISTQGRDGFTTYGQTEWSLTEQNRYMAALAGGCMGDQGSRDFLLGQMAAVGGSDTYGLGSTGLPAKWKGGWGPGTDGRYLVRQMGILEAGGGPVVVTMAAIPGDGSFETGQAMLTEIAARLVERYRKNAPRRASC